MYLKGYPMLNGARIREIRYSKGYTSLDIERISKTNPRYKTSISKSYVEELERGVKLNPSFSKIEILADILRCTLDELRLREITA